MSEIKTASEVAFAEERLYACLKSDLLWSLLRLLREYFFVWEHWCWRIDSLKIPNAIVSVCIVIKSTSNQKWISPSIVIVEITGQRFLHYIDAADRYYGFASDKFDTAMVEAYIAQSASTCEEGEFRVWFVDVLGFRRVDRVYAKETQCRSHNGENRTACESNWRDKMAFVKWYETKKVCTLFTHAIERGFRCAILRRKKRRRFPASFLQMHSMSLFRLT